MSTLNELTCGIANMKFALNHDYLFQNYHLACLCGLLQASAVMMIELVSIQIIFSSLTPLDLVYNFVVLGIITEFDDFVCSSLRNESLKLLINPEVTDQILFIKHTTSKKCKDNELSTVETEDG